MMPSSPDLLLHIEDLTIEFKSDDRVIRAIEHLSVDVYKGRTTAVVGESGSGKSVSSLSLMGLLPIDKTTFVSGTFQFQGEPKRSPSDPILKSFRGKKVAMIFQEPMTALNPVMKCGDQVIEMIRTHTELSYANARKRALELFQEVKLPVPDEMLDRFPHQLSGGQRQRVMIAMAIACNPELLIADEPTTALDVTVQRSILELLQSLQERHGMAMIFITHDLGVVKEIAHHVVVVNKGKQVEQGSVDQIFNHPTSDYTRALIACRPEIGVKRRRLITVADQAENLDYKAEMVHSVRYEKPLIEIKRLHKTYESKTGLFGKIKLFQAVNDVSFIIFENETLGLVGESGCGKTTLSRMLLGLIPATSGEVLYCGKDLCQLSSRELRSLRKEIQIIFQDPYSALPPKMTVEGILTEPMYVYGLNDSAPGRRNRAVELLDLVGMPESSLKKYPHEFSGGQRQRIVIARALAVEPKFIICDESVSALDVSVQAQVLNLLKDLKENFGLTYLFISHDMSVVYHMSDRIMVMNRGCIEELDYAEEVLHRPKSDYTKRLLSAIPGSGIRF